MTTAQSALAEGLADHETDREIADAFDDYVWWTINMLDPCCHDPGCGWLAYAHDECVTALRRYRLLTQIEREVEYEVGIHFQPLD